MSGPITPIPEALTPEAHAVRAPSDLAAGRWAAVPGDGATDSVIDRLLIALRRDRLEVFDIVPTAVVTGDRVQARVVVHVNGANYPMGADDASVVSILMRLEPGIAAAEEIADGLCLGARLACARVEDLHAWSRNLRPTHEAEG